MVYPGVVRFAVVNIGPPEQGSSLNLRFDYGFRRYACIADERSINPPNVVKDNKRRDGRVKVVITR